MNPDAREAAARHLLGLMPPEDESVYMAAAAGDPAIDAARGEIEHLAAVIAVAASPPATPSPESWLRIRAACGLNPAPGVRRHRFLAWSGWGVAAALAILLSLPSGPQPQITALPDLPDGGGSLPPASPDRPPPVRPGPPDSPTDPATVAGTDESESPAAPGAGPGAPISPEAEVRHEPLEKRRLIQELATLRTELSRFRDRDRQLFSATPGRAWPVIIEMLPPGAAGDPSGPDASISLSARVGQALAGLETDPSGTIPEPDPSASAIPDKPAAVPASPRAIPVYDPARDTGTLAIHDLPPPSDGFEYNLWVNPGGDGQPVLAGTLPAGLRTSDALDFSLGTTGILPASYQLTMDPAGTPSAPAASNIVLQGP